MNEGSWTLQYHVKEPHDTLNMKCIFILVVECRFIVGDVLKYIYFNEVFMENIFYVAGSFVIKISHDNSAM